MKTKSSIALCINLQISAKIAFSLWCMVRYVNQAQTITKEVPMPQGEQWVSMREAANITGVSYFRIQRMADRGKLQTKEDELDRRLRLVNVEEVKRVFRVQAS
jgi:hypothetical protein